MSTASISVEDGQAELTLTIEAPGLRGLELVNALAVGMSCALRATVGDDTGAMRFIVPPDAIDQVYPDAALEAEAQALADGWAAAQRLLTPDGDPEEPAQLRAWAREQKQADLARIPCDELSPHLPHTHGPSQGEEPPPYWCTGAGHRRTVITGTGRPPGPDRTHGDGSTTQEPGDPFVVHTYRPDERITVCGLGITADLEARRWEAGSVVLPPAVSCRQCRWQAGGGTGPAPGVMCQDTHSGAWEDHCVLAAGHDLPHRDARGIGWSD